MKLDGSVLYDVYVVGQAVNEMLLEGLADAPLSPTEYAIYSAVFERDPATPSELSKPEATVVRLGPPPVQPDAVQRMFCTCAPVRDYSGHEVARVGLFGHGADDRPILTVHNRGVWDLARRISLRLGHLPPALESTA